MKFTALLPLAALATAIVIPDEAITNQILQEEARAAAASQSFLDRLPSKDAVVDIFRDVGRVSGNALDNAIAAASSAAHEAKTSFKCYKSMTAFDGQAWLDSAVSTVSDVDVLEGEDPADKPPHRKPHHRKPHHHGPPNQTVYEIISKSKYTTKLAALINKYPNLVETLNGTAANYTIFAPTDKAFAKLPEHHKDIPEDVIYQALLYHISPYFYPAGRVLVSHTIPTARDEDSLGGSPQRLRVGVGLKGLAVNFYAHVVAVNIFGTNGVIHGVDSLIFPPPPAKKIIELLPGEFSTLELAIVKTGVFDDLGSTSHTGGTLFAPNNWAFKKLGPKINAFLFSKYGEKYLKALLQYHIVADETLYSDAFYNHAADGAEVSELNKVSGKGIPKGKFHFDLPTQLEGKVLSIDVARYGGFISIKINAFTSVAIQDGIAKDGVVHILSNVLIPPKTKPDGTVIFGAEDEELTVEELKSRLESHVQEL